MTTSNSSNNPETSESSDVLVAEPRNASASNVPVSRVPSDEKAMGAFRNVRLSFGP